MPVSSVFPLVGDAVALVGVSVSMVSDEVARVSVSVALVRDAVTLVGVSVALVGDPVALVGIEVAQIGDPVPLDDTLAVCVCESLFAPDSAPLGGSFSFLRELPSTLRGLFA